MFLSCADGGEGLGQSTLAKRLISVAKAVHAEGGGEGGGGCGMGYGGGGDVVGLERN